MPIKIPLSVELGAIRGVLTRSAPDVLKKSLLDMLEQTNVEKAREWVDNDVNLWEELHSRLKLYLMKGSCLLLGRKVDWITSEWVIGAIRERRPELASLFANGKAYEWLINQIGYIKGEVRKYPCPKAKMSKDGKIIEEAKEK